jgi:hypothetical protein
VVREWAKAQRKLPRLTLEKQRNNEDQANS